jgi:uncharacterized phiE125 gp8 family phage protein
LVLVNSATTAEDTLLAVDIVTAREHVEDITHRTLLTQTWEYYLQSFPFDKNFILIPFGNLQEIVSVKYKDSEGTETTLIENTDYIVEKNGDGCGRVMLPYNGYWPSDALYPSNPITIQFVCGWLSAADIPNKIKQAMLLICGDLYENREAQITGDANEYSSNDTLQNILASARLFEEFA